MNESCPTRQMLERWLARYGDEVVFRTGEGARMKASEMLDALRRNDAVAEAFLRDLHATALDILATRAEDEGERGDNGGT